MTEAEAQRFLLEEALGFWLRFGLAVAVLAVVAFVFRRRILAAIDRFADRHGLCTWEPEEPDPDELPRGYHVRPEHVFVDELADWRPPPAS